MKVIVISLCIALGLLSMEVEPSLLKSSESSQSLNFPNTSNAPMPSSKTDLVKRKPSRFNVTMPVKIGVVLEPPFVMEAYRTGRFMGLMIDILLEAGIPVRPKNTMVVGDYGVEMQPGQFSGILGGLAKGTLDLAVAPFHVHSKRSKAVTFTQPFMRKGFMVLWKPPKDGSTSSYPRTPSTLLQPFTPGLWLLISLAVIPVSVLFFAIRRFNPYEVPAVSSRKPEEKFGTHLLLTLGALFWQSGKVPYKSVSGRVLSLAWWLFALVTVGAYVAALVVVLIKENSKPERTLPFKTIEEMVEQTEVKVLGVKGSSTYQYFSNYDSQENKILQYWNENRDTLLVNSTKTALKMMNEGNGEYAIFMDEASADYLASQEPCDKMVLGDPIGDKGYAFACAKGSLVCEDLNHVILHMEESGQMEGLISKWFHSGCHETKVIFNKGQGFIDSFDQQLSRLLGTGHMTIKKFSSAFIVLGVGLGLAILVLMAEIVYASLWGKPRLMISKSNGRDDQIHMISDDSGFTMDEVE